MNKRSKKYRKYFLDKDAILNEVNPFKIDVK
jgi:hypothetical protein